MSKFCGAVAHDVTNSYRTADVLMLNSTTFSDLLLSNKTLQGLNACGFKKPSPIQLSAIPVGRLGKDLIVQAKSGTGKTLVFSIIALEMLDLSISQTQVLIMAPTREIAVQIKEVIKSIGVGFPGLIVNAFIGGLSVAKDAKAAKTSHIVVGTPGRIKQFIQSNILQVHSVRLFILDEADTLVCQSFKKDICYIFRQLPEDKQTLVISATFPSEMEEFLKKFLVNPRRINPSLNSILLGIRQYVAVVKKHTNVLVRVRNKMKVIQEILSSVPFRQCLIFCNYQSRMEGITRDLLKMGWPVMRLSGTMQQEDRLAALSSLQNHRCRILLSTDLAARGVDADQVDVVINMDLPYDSETFLHRIGRAGRFGSKGIAVSIVEEGEELSKFRNYLFNIGGTDYKVSRLPTSFTPETWTSESHDFVTSESAVEELINCSKSQLSALINDFEENCNENKNEAKAKLGRDDAIATIRQMFTKNKYKLPFASYNEIVKDYNALKITEGQLDVGIEGHRSENINPTKDNLGNEEAITIIHQMLTRNKLKLPLTSYNDILKKYNDFETTGELTKVISENNCELDCDINIVVKAVESLNLLANNNVVNCDLAKVETNNICGRDEVISTYSEMTHSNVKPYNQNLKSCHALKTTTEEPKKNELDIDEVVKAVESLNLFSNNNDNMANSDLDQEVTDDYGDSESEDESICKENNRAVSSCDESGQEVHCSTSSRKKSNKISNNGSCTVCEEWFLNWQREMRMRRQLLQQQLYLNEMLKL